MKDIKKEKFVQKAQKVHGDRYDYSKVDYENSNKKVCIICPIHGTFWQTPRLHISGSGCKKCGIESRKKKLSSNKKDFITKANKKHNNKYDYSKVSYINNQTKVCIVCKKHGPFLQTPNAHLAGYGCLECGKEKISETNLSSNEDFVKKSKQIHGDKYNYSKVEYKHSDKNVTIICKKHGEFKQKPRTHLAGKGCPICGRIQRTINNSSNTKDFIQKAIKLHENRYDYSSVNYINNQTKTSIICKKHGSFLQTPSNHLQGKGCLQCALDNNESIGENEIADFLESLSIKFKRHDRKFIHPLELDFIVHDFNIAIEYDGLFWHSAGKIKNEKKYYHLNKTNLCNQKGYQLLHIFENEWRDEPDIIKSKLKHIFNLTENNIYARKCEIVNIKDKEAKDFFESSHIQGHRNSKVYLALRFNEEIVACMSFSYYKKKNYWELIRYSVKKHTNVPGGFSKLLRHFIKEFHPEKIITFADKRFSQNSNIYNKNGFKLVNETKPNYFYIKNGILFSRQKFQKHKLKNKISNFDKNKTEAENMFANNYRRIWDCGHYKYQLIL